MIFFIAFILVKWTAMVYDLFENCYQVLKPDNMLCETQGHIIHEEIGS